MPVMSGANWVRVNSWDHLASPFPFSPWITFSLFAFSLFFTVSSGLSLLMTLFTPPLAISRHCNEFSEPKLEPVTSWTRFSQIRFSVSVSLTLFSCPFHRIWRRSRIFTGGLEDSRWIRRRDYSLAQAKGNLHGMLVIGLLVEVLKGVHALVTGAARHVAVIKYRLQQSSALGVVSEKKKKKNNLLR